MDKQCRGMITLLRSALKNEALTLPEDFDWSKAANALYEHHLTAMAVRGAARCGISHSEPAIQQLTALFCKDITTSRLQMRQLSIIYDLFQENGIDYMPVKGAVIKPLYPQQELRTMGDADILIRKEQYSRIRELLSSMGMSENIESDHEYVWTAGEFKLELHKRLIPTYNKDYYAYYGDGWRFARPTGQGSAYEMRPEDHFVYLLVHFAKHYRDGSISAKNVCDFWVCRKAYPDMDETYLRAQLQMLNLLEFYQNMRDLLDTWFEGAAPTDAVEILTQTIFNGGIYTQTESNQTFSMIKLTKEGKQVSDSKLKLLWKVLFPPVNALANRYPILLKAPVLLPAVWVIRAFEIVFLNSDRRQKGMDKTRKLMNIDAEQIADYERKLHAVGLNYEV